MHEPRPADAVPYGSPGEKQTWPRVQGPGDASMRSHKGAVQEHEPPGIIKGAQVPFSAGLVLGAQYCPSMHSKPIEHSALGAVAFGSHTPDAALQTTHGLPPQPKDATQGSPARRLA